MSSKYYGAIRLMIHYTTPITASILDTGISLKVKNYLLGFNSGIRQLTIKSIKDSANAEPIIQGVMELDH